MSRDEVVTSQRERLYIAALEAVAELGYGPTTITDIVGRARVARRTFYGLFESKEECFTAAFDFAVDVITRELELFPGRDSSDERLSEKPVIAAANKIDALDDPDRLERLQAHLEKLDVRLFPVSAATGEGVDALLEAVWRELAAARERTAARPPIDSVTE